MSGDQDSSDAESQKPLLIWAADNHTRMAAGGACPPGRFVFGRSFEDMEYHDTNARRMANHRAAYTQDGFFICGLKGGYGQKHEVSLTFLGSLISWTFPGVHSAHTRHSLIFIFVSLFIITIRAGAILLVKHYK